MIKPIAVYDGHTRKRLAFLQNAYNISYDKSTNALWTAEFSLPYSDPKTKYCQSFNNVELWDEDGGGKPQYVGLFRIMPRSEDTLGTEANIVYQLEHVLSTLLDDVMIGYHEIGNLGVYTNRSIGYILENQSEKRWVLGKCDYAHQFLYGWQDENLLSALFSIVQPFEETDYYWDFDTTAFPWQLNLLRTVKDPVLDIRYRKNLNGLTRIIDPSNLTTRLYCYGYGQGDNKLNITQVNNGVPYLESPNVNKYGVITQIWTDERFTVADSLFEVGKKMLKRLEEPSVSYEIDLQTIHSAANLQIGDTVRMVSIGIDEPMVVKNITKDNVTGASQSGRIVLGDGTIDISNSIADLIDRQRIAETYSQGAESIFTDSFVDNADGSNPAEIVFTIPENVVHVNEIRFSCQLTNFRAYSKAVEGGGGGMTTTEAGGSTTPTTSSGGGFTPTSSSGGGSTPSTSSGGGVATTSGSGGADDRTTSSGGGEVETTYEYKLMSGTSGDNTYATSIDGVSGSRHSHGLYMHGHYIDIPNHRHDFSVRSHRHDIDIPNHTHYTNISPHTHSVNIDPHTHTVSIGSHKHEISLLNHVHGIQYGIYQGPRASSMKVYLDDMLIGTYTSDIRDLNLIDYMSKNANGNIMRGNHVIRIVPNTLTRVECTFQIRLFTNMHGGRQY